MDRKDVVTGFIINAAFIVLGLVMLITPTTGLSELIIIFAAALILYGVIVLVQFINARSKGETPSLLPIILSLVIGVLLLIFNRFAANIVLPLIIGIWAIINGVLMLSNAFQFKKLDSAIWWLPAIFATIYLILGIIITCNLFATSAVVSILLGVLFLVFGLVGLIWSCSLISLRKKFHS